MRGNAKLSANTSRGANKKDAKIGMKLLVHVALIEEIVVVSDCAHEMGGYETS